VRQKRSFSNRNGKRRSKRKSAQSPMSDDKKKTRLEQTLLFARTFLRHPMMLGSAIPSSRFLTENLMRQMDWKQARVVVEYGPGVGTLTAEMLRRMLPDAMLVAIEMNGDFVHYLKNSFSDSRLHVVHGSAADVAQVLERLGLDGADYIISGIPYSTMPPEIRDKILRESCRLLRSGGAFLVYQFTGAVLPHLRETFGYVRQGFELRNLLPARIFYCVP
jgi:phospholipid N-methyltransferase